MSVNLQVLEKLVNSELTTKVTHSIISYEELLLEINMLY